LLSRQSCVVCCPDRAAAAAAAALALCNAKSEHPQVTTGTLLFSLSYSADLHTINLLSFLARAIAKWSFDINASLL
jgi:hypothetical protein